MDTFLSSHPFLSALLISVIAGIPVTALWTEICHWLFLRNDPSPRARWISAMFGVLERALLTTFVLWLPMAAGPFAGAWIVVKAVIGWGDHDLKQTTHESATA
ncbi:MAG: hypothetical protein WBG18_03865 [Xanthobacteraceae bacterium]|jgi:hypothetical protein